MILRGHRPARDADDLAAQSTELPLPNHPPFRPAWWLPGAHLHTIWGKLARRIPDVHERVEQWTAPDGDTLSVARLDGASPDAPVLAIFHGLEGTVRSNYAQGLMHQARARGWGAAMLIWRTCDGRIPSTPRLYHSGETRDADFFVRTLAAERPVRPIFCAGVSLGGNVLLKWLGEEGDAVPREVERAAAISTPFDLGAGSEHLQHGFSRVYIWHFLRTLRQKAAAVFRRFPDLPVDPERVDRSRTLREFDDAFTGPVHGFAGADDYYARSSSLRFLPKITVPTLLFSAYDDPFLPPVVLDRVRTIAQGNPMLRTEFTRLGGHVGWVAGQPWAQEYFMEGHVAHWLGNPAVPTAGA